MDTYQPKPRGTYTIYLLLKTIIFFFWRGTVSRREEIDHWNFFKKKKKQKKQKKKRERERVITISQFNRLL